MYQVDKNQCYVPALERWEHGMRLDPLTPIQGLLEGLDSLHTGYSIWKNLETRRSVIGLGGRL